MNNNQNETSVQGTDVLNNHFTTYYNEVVQGYPSVYTKDDVILFLNRIKSDMMKLTESVPTKEGKSQDEILDIVRDFVRSVDIDDYTELGLDGREISIDFFYNDFFDHLKESVENE